MADGGRYRKRRHAAFGARAGEPIHRKPHQPHYQSRDYNPLNGGIARWFDPVLPEIAAGPSMTAILGDLPRAVRAPGTDARLAHRGAPVPHRGAQRRGGPADPGGHASRRRGLRAGAADRPPQHPERRHLDPRRRTGAISAASRWPSRSMRRGWTITGSCTASRRSSRSIQPSRVPRRAGRHLPPRGRLMARVFAVIRSRGPAWDETRSMEQQTDWAGHATFMDALYAEGFVVLVGPLEGTRDALLIARADDANQIEARLSADPWTGSTAPINDQHCSMDAAPGLDRPGQLSAGDAHHALGSAQLRSEN